MTKVLSYSEGARATLGAAVLALLTACGAPPPSHLPVEVETPEPRLVALELTPTEPSLPAGARVRVVARGVYSDYRVADVSADVQWTVSNATVLSVRASDEGRHALALAPGHALLTAQLGGLRKTTLITVRDVELEALELTAVRVARGAVAPLVAHGRYADGSRADLTGAVRWETSDPERLGFVGTLAQGRELGRARVTATLLGLTAEGYVEVSAAERTGLQVHLERSALAKLTRTRARALIVHSDGSTLDVTALAQWRSDAPAVAAVANDGQVTSAAPGSARLTATYDGFSGGADLRVTSASLSALTLRSLPTFLPKGRRVQLQVLGVFSDGTEQDLTREATWTSDAPGVLEASAVPSESGLLWARAQGSGWVTATAFGAGVSAPLTVGPAERVSLELRVESPVLARGLTQQLRLFGRYTDDTTRELTSSASWSASNGAVAELLDVPGRKGELRGLLPGAVDVRAQLGTEDAQATVTVGPAALLRLVWRAQNLDLDRAALPLGALLQLEVDGVFSDGQVEALGNAVELRSSDESVLARSEAGPWLAAGGGVATMTAAFKGREVQLEVTVVAP